MDPFGAIDSAFLSLETGTSRLHVGMVLVLDPPEGRRSLFSPSTRFAQVRRMIEQRVHTVEALRRRPVPVALGLGHPVWAEDPEFDLDRHVRRAALPSPGGQNELDQLVADFMSGGLDLERPLWEMVVVEGLAEGRTAIVTKLHHAILDGVSGASLLSSFLDPGPRGRPEPAYETGEASRPIPLRHRHDEARPSTRGPSQRELLGQFAVSLTKAPATVRSAVGLGIVAIRRALDPESTPGPRPVVFGAPRTGLNGTVSERRRFATTSMVVGDLELVRRAFRTSQNDAVLAAVAGALRQLLDARSDLGTRPLVALVPVSTRRRDARRSLGNQIAGMLVTLPTNVADPIERLAAVAASARAAKARYRATGGRLLRDVVDLSPPVVVQRVARWSNALHLFDRTPPVANLVVSNVPGPSRSLWFAGGRVVALYPVGAVAHGMGINITAMRYGDRLWMGLLACGKLAPDVEDLARLVDASLHELVAAAGGAEQAAVGADTRPARRTV